ncbi:MAG TPA: pyridoxamine 5'-phosphate oxidase family protein, partial [Ktedonobacterales bacterium]|nr:pyridoxamine 5'-phosphate oxidase family protein [Ktedonobacterales bacterium]
MEEPAFPAFQQTVTSVEELEAILGQPSESARRKQIDYLDEHCRRLIALSPLVMISTANRAGWCDVSPKGDAPSFVQT